MIAISHPTGNANVRNALRALQEAEMLEAFVTTIAAYPDNLFGRLASTRIGAEFSRRGYNPALAPLTRQYPTRELLRLTFNKAGINNLTRHEEGPFCIDKVYRHLDKSMAKRLRQRSPSLQAVYCYEDGALESFSAARDLDLTTIYDLPIGYWRAGRRLQSEEAELQPEWASTMPALIDSNAKLSRKDEELRLADHVLVASQFTADTLKEAPFNIPAPSIIPYGCPPVRMQSEENVRHSQSSKLRVLFVGGLSQRKGLSYLFEAVEQLSTACELTVIGRRPTVSCQPLDAALSRHNWIESLPHNQILEQMRSHDVLVFPSLFEGFGLVVTEALSQGIPVITTPNTCGPDVLTDGEDGFIVPIRDADAIKERLELLHRDREKLAAMKGAALRKATVMTWQNYRQALADAVKFAVID